MRPQLLLVSPGPGCRPGGMRTLALAAALAGCAASKPPHPPLPTLPAMRTCAPGSPAAAMAFCEQDRSHEERAALLAAELTLDEAIVLWALHAYHYPIPRLNIKGLHRDTCCVHGAALNFMEGPWRADGLEPKFVTVMPHAINHGAMFDLELVRRLANATANEMRAASQIRYRTSNGQAFAAVACDSGPLANTAHHPAWGRIAETYGECPFLVAQTGVAVTATMQGRTADGTLKTALTTRHYMGYHATNTMPDPQMNVTERDLYDAYLPQYRAFALQGGAEGIMCGFGSFDGTPSCANQRLLGTELRGKWGADSVVQSDCCDSITSIKSLHNFTDTFPQAVAAAFDAGAQLCFGCDPFLDHGHSANASQYLKAAISAGLVKEAAVRSAVGRVMLTRFRLGEMDEGKDRPYQHVDESLLDSAEHRALAREAAAASIVLASNTHSRLPVAHLPATPRIVVIGPFADCNETISGGWSKTNCYLHSYAGIPSKIVSLLEAVREEALQLPGNATVDFYEGSTDQRNISAAAFEAAVEAVSGASLVVMALGTGSNVEKESTDRLSLGLPTVQQQLLDAVSAKRGAASSTTLVVVCVSAGPVAIDPSLADALLYAGYGGEEAGHGIADVIFGHVSPSGRFPTTVYNSTYLSMVGPVSDYSSTSGVGRTYRYLDTKLSPPIFSFGFGLSCKPFNPRLHTQLWALAF